MVPVAVGGTESQSRALDEWMAGDDGCCSGGCEDDDGVSENELVDGRKDLLVGSTVLLMRVFWLSMGILDA